MSFVDLRRAAQIYGAESLHAMAEAIWPEYQGRPWRSMAKYISCEDTLGPFWAMIAEGEPIGVTGWFRADYLPKGSVGLRWTGVHPLHRGRGAFRASIEQVINDVGTSAPEVGCITELAPVAWAPQILPAFKKIGFEVLSEKHQTRGTDPLFEGAYVLIYKLSRGP